MRTTTTSTKTRQLSKAHHSHDPVDDNDDDDDDDDNDNNDNDGDHDDDDDGLETPAHNLRSKSHKKRASRNLPRSSIKKKNSREIRSVREGQLLYNRSLALQACRNKEKKKNKGYSFTEHPTKLTDTDACCNYLEHQLEQRHNETVAQRTQDYNRLSSAARISMTPEKIKQLHQAKREKQEALQALKEVKRDDERREEEE
jgi:hypothetical protein